MGEQAGMRRWLRLVGSLLAGVCLGVLIVAEFYQVEATLVPPTVATDAHAEARTTAAQAAQAAQAASAWLALKQAHRVVAPDRAGKPVVYLSATPATYPAVALLDTSVIAQTLEPGGIGTDAAGNSYSDPNMWDLCGPAAANNALYFWNGETNRWGEHIYTDPSNGVTMTWDDTDNRAYTMELAWYVQPPTWQRVGMMDAHNPSYGVTLYGMRDGLNWEASAHDTRGWQQYFYSIRWWNAATPATLLADVESDVGLSGKPVVAEVNAQFLPNWPALDRKKNHFITIVGYDNTTRQYTYTDTCGHSTGCGSNTDAGSHQISYAMLWQAITSLPVNQSDDPHAGDGGWVW